MAGIVDLMIAGLSFAIAYGMLNSWLNLSGTDINPYAAQKTNLILLSLSFVPSALYMAYRDFRTGQSIGKKLYNIRVIHETSGQPASRLQNFFHNILWPIKPFNIILWFLVKDPSHGILDRISGTKVVEDEGQEWKQPRYQRGAFMVSVVIAYILLTLTIVPVFYEMHILNQEAIMAGY